MGRVLETDWKEMVKDRRAESESEMMRNEPFI